MEKIVEIIEFIQYIAITFAILTILPSIINLMEKDFFSNQTKTRSLHLYKYNNITNR